MQSNKLLLLFIAVSTVSCSNRIVNNEFIGKEIRFPEKPIFTRFISDTLDYSIPTSKFKILLSVDSTDCTGCKLQLDRWKDYISEMKTTMSENISFLFFIQPKDTADLKYILINEDFEYPVCIDTKGDFAALNHLSSDQVFLLNDRNEILATGNPTQDLQIKMDYLQKISGERKKSTNLPKTSACVDVMNVNFGAIDLSIKKDYRINIWNTGNNPLVILDVITSCGCIKSEFDKKPANPGDTIPLIIHIVPKDPGYINKTVTIKANTDEDIAINIKGHIR